jgi:hypothetical protein
VPHLVDGDNLLGSWPGRDRSHTEKRMLAREVGRFATAERRRIVVVFDGAEPVPPFGGSEVLFAGSGRSADDLILATLRRESDPKGWTVVTSDRSLGDRCRHAGARVERCDQFRARLSVKRPDEKPTPEDVEYWKEVFERGEPGEPT